MKKIYELSKIYGFKILEDASHAIGSEYYGNKIGNCKYSDITVFSFHPVKIITTGEGGIATTNDFYLAARTYMATRKPTKKSTRKPAAKRRPTNLDATFLLPPKDELHLMIEEWVAEDVGLQDLTTNIMIPSLPGDSAKLSCSTRRSAQQTEG